jgi:hypothetical protein
VILVDQDFAQDCKATLEINSDCKEVNIFINDALVASGTDYRTEIELGTHIIKVVKKTKKWNAGFFIDTIDVNDCSEVKLNYSFENEILLSTEPQNVYVFRNDSLVGYTPLLLKPDFKSLVLKKPEYLSKETTFDEIVSNEKIYLEFIGEENSDSFYETAIFKVLVGTAIALGAATAYLKLEADNRFEEYKLTGDPELLDQTDRLDIISGVSFVALQLNFGLIIYLFLSD